MKYFALFAIFAAAAAVNAQSGRVSPASSAASPSSSANVPVKTMFDEANGYNKAKFTEYEAKKVAYSENLRLQTVREQKQLAAKYAAAASARPSLSGEDHYYIGLLHWIAENLDGTSESLRRYLASPDPAPDKAQTARSIVAVVAAKQRKFDEAMAAIAEYSKNTPNKLSDRTRMRIELAKAYFAEKKWADAAAQAAEAYASAKAVLLDSGVTQRGLDETLDTGMQLFESHRAAGNVKEADAALDDLRKTGASIGSASLFAYGADKLITYMIESGRKALAMETYLNSLIQASKELSTTPSREQAIALLKKREKQYKL